MPNDTTLEADLFAFLSRKYVQRQDDRQKAMGLIYTTAETHDLAHEVVAFLARRASVVEDDAPTQH